MIESIITIGFVYFLYYFVSVRKYDKFGNLKHKDTKNFNDKRIEEYKALPNEARYFIKKYNIDIEKLNKRGLLKLIGLILAIDVSLIVLVLSIFIDDIFIELLIASILLLPVYLISLKILGTYFKRKGWIKNEKLKRNRT